VRLRQRQDVPNWRQDVLKRDDLVSVTNDRTLPMSAFGVTMWAPRSAEPARSLGYGDLAAFLLAPDRRHPCRRWRSIATRTCRKTMLVATRPIETVTALQPDEWSDLHRQMVRVADALDTLFQARPVQPCGLDERRRTGRPVTRGPSSQEPSRQVKGCHPHGDLRDSSSGRGTDSRLCWPAPTPSYRAAPSLRGWARFAAVSSARAANGA
jgi:hypothetical protein